jgi:CubicO group peptidase (beta-lactamase class C family)
MGNLNCLIVALLLGFLTGCRDTAGPNLDSPGEAPTGHQRVSPIVSFVSQRVDAGGLIGAEVLILEHGEVILHSALGWRDKEENARMEKNTIFRLFSNTKPILGTAVLMLRDRGLLSLSDPVGRYIPGFNNPDSRDISLRHLITHTAGLDYPVSYPSYESLEELAQDIGEVGPVLPVGKQFLYSDRGSAALAAVVSVVSGMPVEDFIQKEILEPLGMTDTFFDLSDEDPRRSRMSSTYAWQGGQVVKFWDRDSPQVARYFRGYSGMYSTPSDYLDFLRIWMQGGTSDSLSLLSPETVAEALLPTPQSVSAGFPYGYHWEILRGEEPIPTFGHSGFARTYAWADPGRELLVAFFTQCVLCPDAESTDFIRVVEDALF